MKTTLLSFLAVILSLKSYSQIKVSVGGFYSSPLEQFCIDDYSDGGGVDFGLVLVRNIDSTWSMEGGLNWQYGLNGKKTAELPLGDYDLKNSFFNWQLKFNLVKRIKNVSPYMGVHFGGGSYYTSEYLSFAEPQEDQVNYYNDVLYKSNQLQYGGQLGTYVHLNEFVSLNFGISINKSDAKVKYIDFETYTFDGDKIDYQEKTSAPLILLFHAGISFKLHPVFPKRTSRSYTYSHNDYETESECSGGSTAPTYHHSSSSSTGKPSDTHYQKKSSPTLIKNGKTPVGFK
jgi:hypothetical protein